MCPDILYKLASFLALLAKFSGRNQGEVGRSLIVGVLSVTPILHPCVGQIRPKIFLKCCMSPCERLDFPLK